MRTRLIAIVLAVLPLLALQNLQASELTDNYYPLKPGMTWTYSVTSDKHETKKIIVTNLPAREISDLSLTPRKWDTAGNIKYYLIGTDSQGTYRYGEQKSEKDEPVLTKPKVYYLKEPIGNGTTWDINTRMGQDDLTINLTIESINDTIKVPAGAFQDCVKIKHAGGNQKDDVSLTLEAYEWYAPKVGLVKSVVTIKKLEKKETKYSEHLNYQLESFQP